MAWIILGLAGLCEVGFTTAMKYADGFTKLSDAERAHFMKELGLSDPLVVQYLGWIKSIA